MPRRGGTVVGGRRDAILFAADEETSDIAAGKVDSLNYRVRWEVLKPLTGSAYGSIAATIWGVFGNPWTC